MSFCGIINFGVKTNRCPNLAFQIEMPVKDNEVIEHRRRKKLAAFGLRPHMASPRCGQYALLAFLPVCGAGDVQTAR
ncbi:MAG: hypothetical protein ACLSAH_14450 [Bilophila wadsworthia]